VRVLPLGYHNRLWEELAGQMTYPIYQIKGQNYQNGMKLLEDTARKIVVDMKAMGLLYMTLNMVEVVNDKKKSVWLFIEK
jgi:hypothetical protein